MTNCYTYTEQVIVHRDGGDYLSADVLRSAAKHVVVVESEDNLGPGGGRNRLMEKATTEIVVSFYDASFLVDSDFFVAVTSAIARRPTATVIAMSVIHDYEAVVQHRDYSHPVADFVGKNSVIGAGSVVTRDLPAGSSPIGVPARCGVSQIIGEG